MTPKDVSLWKNGVSDFYQHEMLVIFHAICMGIIFSKSPRRWKKSWRKFQHLNHQPTWDRRSHGGSPGQRSRKGSTGIRCHLHHQDLCWGLVRRGIKTAKTPRDWKTWCIFEMKLRLDSVFFWMLIFLERFFECIFLKLFRQAGIFKSLQTHTHTQNCANGVKPLVGSLSSFLCVFSWHEIPMLHNYRIEF